MQYPLLNFFCSSLIPILSTDISTSSSGNIHLCLVTIATVRTFPHQLFVFVGNNGDFSRVVTQLAAIAFCVQLCIHDVLVNVTQQRHNCRNIAFHVGHFHVANGTTGRKLLELRLKGKLAEGINGFCYMNVIAVGNVILVGNARNNTEPLLEALGEFIGSRFQRRSIQRVLSSGVP